MFFALLLAIASLTAILSANAQDTESAQEAISVSAQEIASASENSVDLGIENPGMLPTSPFYFLKEWKRKVNKFFTFNPVKKAELELDEINQRAAEMEKMEEVAPQNIRAISKAASNYQKNVEQFKNRLEALKETSQNPNIDKLLDKLVDRSLKHQELFDSLKKKFEVRQEISEQIKTELKEKLEVSREWINEAVSKIPKKFENVERFRQRLENAVENQSEGALKELRAVEILERVKEKLPEEQRAKIQEAKEKIIEKFETRMGKLDENEKMRILAPEVLEKLQSGQIKPIKPEFKNIPPAAE